MSSNSQPLQDDPRLLAAVRSRDASSDGHFVYAVSTTGVYCRPSCKSRPARPEHIAFYATAADAERAGFRPCKRCKPNLSDIVAPNVALVTRVCRLIEESTTALSLNELAARSGLSPSRLHHVFKTTTGITPKAYADAQRKKRLHEELQTSPSVTRAMYDSGFNSSGRFYEQADRMLGMTPLAFKRGGSGLAIRFALGECSLGMLLVASSARGVCWIAMGDDPASLTRDVQRQFPNAELVGEDPHFDALLTKVVSLVEDPNLPIELPLDIRGTAFQCRVWEALRHIPVGKTISYAELAATLGSPKAVRAVARACATNALAVVIPCHRVVRSDGGLSGYRWGVERKRALLSAESADRALFDADASKAR